MNATNSAFCEHREPCPFCGAESTGFTRNDGYAVIWCSNCGASGPTGRNIGPRSDNDQVALRRWNERLSLNGKFVPVAEREAIRDALEDTRKERNKLDTECRKLRNQRVELLEACRIALPTLRECARIGNDQLDNAVEAVIAAIAKAEAK